MPVCKNVNSFLRQWVFTDLTTKDLDYEAWQQLPLEPWRAFVEELDRLDELSRFNA